MKNNEDSGNREKKKEKLDISFSNPGKGFLNFLRFKAFTILVTLKILLLDVKISSLPRHKKFANF